MGSLAGAAEEFLYRADHILDLLVRKLRVHRERNNLALTGVGDGEIGRPVLQIAIGGHERECGRVMNAGGYALGLEEVGELVPPRRTK